MLEARIRRSTLIMPVHLPRLVEKAYLRGADCICLDLEDSVPTSLKENAREAVKLAITLAGKGGAEVIVRINNSGESTILSDLRASVWPDLSGIILPKVETDVQVMEIENDLETVERERALVPGSIRLWAVVETAKGVKNVFEIAASSKRLDFLSAGDEDLALDLGITPTVGGSELGYVKSRVVIAARAAGITPLGLAGTLADFTDLDGLRRSAMNAKSMGFKGAMAIHPSQIQILNEAFSPATEEIEAASTIIELYEKALSEGKASIQFQGKMVDTPVYQRAKKTMELANSIREMEAGRRPSTPNESRVSG
ncbi:MAG: CoA ester lyase [Thaumarchaeota archaeon]|nr:CoA ester lyase [Nitrososphaerota archaeon]